MPNLMQTIFRHAAQMILLVSACLMLNAANTEAGILTVTKTADTNDLACDGDCSLREAILAAASGDEIQFASPLFDAPQIITLSDSLQQLLVSKSVTITGKGAHLLTVRRAPAAAVNFRIFNINVSGQVNLSGLTITGGNAASGGGLSITGGVVVTLTNGIITGNAAAIGGAINIGNNQTLNLINSTISNNTSNNISGNSSAGISGNFSILNIINSTISGNTITGGGPANGGAIRNSGSGTVNITNSTITNNSTDGLSSTNAGGILNGSGTTTIRNSIVAGNNGTVPDVYGDIDGLYISGGYNLIGKNNGAASIFPAGNPNANNDIVGTIASPVDPLLDPLGMYGGTTPTHRLQTLPVVSPAIDKGSNLGGLTTDQRGLMRPYDDPTIPNAGGANANGSDIGAFEAQAVTAASLSISGRIIDASGRALREARVLLTGSTGETRMALANPSGFYRFDEVLAGETYTFQVQHQRYSFAAQVMTARGETNNLNFVALRAEPKSTQTPTTINVASQTAVKIAVKHEAWYRVTAHELFAAGLSRQVAAAKLQLWVAGVEIPIAVSTDIGGRFDESSYIEFYGNGIDTPASDVRVYWLIAANTPGKRIEKLEAGGDPSSAQSFSRAIEKRDRIVYFPSVLNGERENFFGAVVTTSPIDETLTLCHLASNVAKPASVEVTLQGVTQQAHRVLAQFNGKTLGFLDFEGQQNFNAEFSLPQELLREGANTVRLLSQNGARDISLVDHIRIRYRHTFTADADKLRVTVTGGERTRIGGFTTKAIRVFDVTDADQVSELAGKIAVQKDRTYAITVAAPKSGERSLLALADGQEARPLSIKAERESHWRDPNNGADVVIVTCHDFFPAFEKLKEQREQERLSVALVDIEDIYDEFNFGNKSPQSLKDFLFFAHTNWHVKPRFVLLAADASFDSRNYLGFGDNDIVPTKLVDTAFMETASDDWLADFTGDGISELAIGRMPARSVKEAESLVSKTLHYASSTPVASALLVADANDGYDFEQASAELRGLLESQLQVEELQRGRLPANEAKTRLLEAFSKGQKLINYIGHGSVDLWRGHLLNAEEARALTNQTLPVMVMMTCLNGYFHDAAMDSLGESLLKAERGGAIAVWASSGMTTSQEQSLMNIELYRLLFDASSKAVRLGEAAREAKQAIANMDIRRTWVLLGDPTLLVR